MNGPNLWLSQSCYSFLQGSSRPIELIQEAEIHGYQGICISDFDGVYGLVKAYLAGKEHKDIKIFYGAQTRINLFEEGIPNKELRSAYEKLGDNQLPVFLQDRLSYMAQDKNAYAEICSLLTHTHRHGKQATAIPAKSFSDWPKSAYAIMPQRGVSQLFSTAQRELFEDWLKSVATLHEIHRGRFFLALTPPSCATERNAFENHIEAHRRLNVPLIATDDAFFHVASHKYLHDALTAVRMNQAIKTIPWACFQNSERRIHKPESIKRFCSQNAIFEKAYANNLALSAGFNFCLSELRYQYPNEFIPHGHTAFSWLQKLVVNALETRYPNGCPERLRSLVEKELFLVLELSFADYFLTVWDIVRFAREKKILCQGRGSAANSAICFLLGITAVDPMVSDVLFERFISRERGEPPDIDVDFEHERREEVIQYIYERYGRHRAAMVANVITFQTKGSIRAAAKALDLDETRAIEVLYRDKPVEPHEDKSAFEDCLSLSKQIFELPRHLGIHSGGFVVTQKSLTCLTPIEPASMEGRSVIQWNKDDIESLGIFKIDVLALGMLTALRKIFASLSKHRHRVPGTLQTVSLESIPPNCPKTYQMIQNARTTGVFQIESRAQMSILPRILPREFYDLVVSIGIVRPGPIVSGMVNAYVKRRTGKERVYIPDARLKPILQRTLGVPIFQEQIMRIAMAVADFSPGEADELRRAMGAWKISGNMKSFEEKLRSGMKKNNIPDEFAEVIFKQVEGFSQYGFPESHATSFAHLAYASAWLKAHFPAHFLCGLLNSQPMGFYSAHSLLQEAKLAGVQIIEPCLIQSSWESFVNSKGAVQLGLCTIATMREEHVQVFLDRRKQLKNPNEIFEAMNCFHSHERIALAMGGCLHHINNSRRDVLWKILAESRPLLEDEGKWIFPPNTAAVENWDNVRDDLTHKGYAIDHHPMDALKKIAWPFSIDLKKVIPANAINTQREHANITVAGLVVIRQRPPTAKGMVFITLEDETGCINLVLKPDIFERYKKNILEHDLLCCSGIRQSNGRESTVMLKVVHPLLPSAEDPRQRLDIESPPTPQDSIFGTCPEIQQSVKTLQ
jgi:error-prone DNA polymerase